MPVEMVTRVNAPASRAEMERRWAAVREVMAEAQIDVLVAHSHVDGIGGGTRWLSDLGAGGGYPTTVIFHRSEPITAIVHGPFGGERLLAADDEVFHIGRLMNVASFASVASNLYYDADLALEILRGLKPRRAAYLWPGEIPYPLLSRLIDGLAPTEVLDASDLVDPIKAVKSPEELEVLRATAAMQDAALAHAFDVAEPGMRECDLGAEVQRFSWERGSEAGIYMIGSAPVGEPAMFQMRHHQQRAIEDGDQLTFVVENSGAGGYYSHVGRTAIFGDAPQQMLEEHAFAVGAQQMIVDMLTPGANPREIISAYDDYMESSGRPRETRLVGHGQGYDLVERPLLRADESMPIEEGMQIGVHPIYVRNGVFGYACDDYIVGPDGASRIHTTPQILFQL
jgi:Xaa-Pro aminopeptidase